MNQKIETDREEENGNTIHSLPSKNQKKQSNQIKNWFFTWNNYPNDAIETLETTFKQICIKYVFQREIGEETNTPHIQGSIWCKKSIRYTEMKLPKTIHWEKMRNEEASIKYCQKSATSIGEPILFGFPKPIKIISELREYQKVIENIYLTEPDDRAIYWFYEDIGNVGKSAFCKYMYSKHGVLFCNGGKSGDLINLCFNTDMDNTKAVIWDIPRASQNAISYSAVEQIKNGLICNTKYETGNKIFNPPHIFIFANFPPRDTHNLSIDRWNIYRIDETFSLTKEFI